jgi:hypothetical protein
MGKASFYEFPSHDQHTKFCVIRKSDGERLNEGLETKEAAEKWIEDYNKSMAG